jgi:hypothetical protein
MSYSNIDFHKISQALTYTIDAIQSQGEQADVAVERLQNAQEELKQALSFSLTSEFK